MRECQGADETLLELADERPVDGEGSRLHLGWGSFRNLDLAAARRSDAVLLLDVNVHQLAVWGAVRRALAEAGSAPVFIDRLLPLLPRQQRLRQFAPPTPEGTRGWLRGELERPGSWLYLDAEARYRHLRERFGAGAVGLGCVDLRRRGSCATLATALQTAARDEALRLDTVYVSNLPWMLAQARGFFGEDHADACDDADTPVLAQVHANLAAIVAGARHVVSAMASRDDATPDNLQWRTRCTGPQEFLSDPLWPTAPAAGRAPRRSSIQPLCAAIDFGTSNSAVALVQPASGGVELVELEPGHRTMPTAVFYRSDEPGRHYGRDAIAAYVDGHEGRLMRSMKSVLGSDLIEQATDVGDGRAVKFADVVAGYLAELKRRAEASAGAPLTRLVLGRPVFFVDDDALRDARAQAALEAAARRVGFDEVRFQYEPIAAALDHEQHSTHEHCVLVADIGGGTSDFSVVRVGPRRRGRADRRDDILASHGVHIAGTDFDRHVELKAILPLLGLGARRPARGGQPAREVPSGVYYDLATWHLINTVYAPARVAELRAMHDWYADPGHHRRLMRVVDRRLGHALAAAAEQAKIDVATDAHAAIRLDEVEPALGASIDEAAAAAAIESDLARIVAAARETVRLAGLAPEDIETLYCTGGSTGLAALVRRIAAGLPRARVEQGDRFASVVHGLGVHAATQFRA